MKQQEFEIINRLGLHARASAMFVKTSSKFSSEILLAKEGVEVNGKSIMGIMMLAAAKGNIVKLTVKGDDESEAFTAIANLINNGFGED